MHLVAGTGYLQVTQPNGVASDGKIVGYFYDANYVYHGFLHEWSGKIITIDAPNAGTGTNQGTNATSINVDGEIAGYIEDSNNVYHGFVRSRCGGFTLFDVPNAGKGKGQGTVVLYGGALNSQGEICGFYFDPTGAVLCYLRVASGLITTFDPLTRRFAFPVGLTRRE
jgi:probable HAF family extracellular repeat protein